MGGPEGVIIATQAVHNYVVILKSIVVRYGCSCPGSILRLRCFFWLDREREPRCLPSQHATGAFEMAARIALAALVCISQQQAAADGGASSSSSTTTTTARHEWQYECHANTDASGGHDIELPWVSTIQNETDCRAACDSLANCSAYVVANETGHPARFTCGGCWLKADPDPTHNPLGPGDPFGQATCRKYCGKQHLPLYTCAGAQCVLVEDGARVTFTDPQCFGQCPRRLGLNSSSSTASGPAVVERLRAAKTDDDEGSHDDYLAGQTGVLLENEPQPQPPPPQPPQPPQEELPAHRRDYRYGQTGVLLDNQSEL